MAATIAVYMFVVGVTALFWGPFCDRWGRRNTLLISCALFTGFSTGCVFVPHIESKWWLFLRAHVRSGRTVNTVDCGLPLQPTAVCAWLTIASCHPLISVLIAFRALQGAAVSALMVAANAVLADSWEPAQRGKAMGVFSIPTREFVLGTGQLPRVRSSGRWPQQQAPESLTPHGHPPQSSRCAVVGPIVGPLLGGGLSQALGWRSTFASMAVCGAIIFVALLVLMEEVRVDSSSPTRLSACIAFLTTLSSACYHATPPLKGITCHPPPRPEPTRPTTTTC